MCYVFSDESGTWNDSEFYIRAWVKISKTEYKKLEKETESCLEEIGLQKELKWKIFKKHIEKIGNILKRIQFSIYITLSQPRVFKQRGFSIIKALESIPEWKYTGGTEDTKRLKNKIINSAWNTLFLNVYEKQHIKNSIAAFKCDIFPCDYIVDSPQFLNKMWEEVAIECGIDGSNLKIIKDSGSCIGIQIADIISGCTSECLSRDERKRNQALQIFSQYFRAKMVSGSNPNLIFYSEFDKETKKFIRSNLASP